MFGPKARLLCQFSFDVFHEYSHVELGKFLDGSGKGGIWGSLKIKHVLRLLKLSGHINRNATVFFQSQVLRFVIRAMIPTVDLVL